jgi:Leucine-rich repeat (LRR) protein
MTGLDGVPSLRIVNLRHNKIEKIDEELVPLESLEYLNLRTNKIPDMENLVRLFQYPALVKLNVLNCPVELGYSSMNMFIAEVLAKKTGIKRFCQVDITDSHKLESVYLTKYKWEVEEEKRKKKEADEAAAEKKR